MASLEAYVFMLFIATQTLFAIGDPQVPCYFIFGDSLYDNGNNNNLVTEAKANFPPYGIDFPDGPTGRFSNGRNIPDVIAQLLGFEKSIPPFASASPEDIIRGVNYASGAAGIRHETGQHMGGRISLNQQLAHHATIILQLVDSIGNGSLAPVTEHLNKCIYTVAMGNNDFINNYFLPNYYETGKYPLFSYIDQLIELYTQQLTKLYEYGARKFGVPGAGYSGCTPAMMVRYNSDECVTTVNGAIVQFNVKLATALVDLESKLPEAKFIYLEPPLGYSADFNVTDKACCTISTTVGYGQCVPNQEPCTTRANYVFWDGFHPTEGISVVDGTTAYAAMSPFYESQANISTPVSDEGVVGDA